MYSQILRDYKDAITERVSYFNSLADEVLPNDPDGENLRRSFHSRTNPVKAVRKIVEHEERAERFLKAFGKMDPWLYNDLRQYGPRGRFVRKAPPAVTLTEKVCAALGDKAHALRFMLLIPEYARKITHVYSAVDVLMAHEQLLPEEYAELNVNSDDEYTMIRYLENLCGGTTIPEPNRRFISLPIVPWSLKMSNLIRFSQPFHGASKHPTSFALANRAMEPRNVRPFR
uniref:uncharacterized protein LOC109958396 n=1 Tax=Monopterus albus TaxID=43700 RepID=UPI0009B300D1|nr:uncharacterized protein LOC109958396 [Monopterus albus]